MRRFHPHRPRAVASVLFAAALGLSACGSSDASDDSTGSAQFDLQLRFTPSTQFAASYVAEKDGYYESSGLDVTIHPGGAAISVEPLLVQGERNVGLSNPGTTAQAVKGGADLTIIAAGYQHAAGAIISLPDEPLAKPQDLRGKRIGVPSLNTSVQRFLTANGVDPDDVKIVPIQGDASPLINGQVDAIYGTVNRHVPTLEAEGYKPVVMKYADFGMDGLDLTYTVATKSLKDKKVRAQLVDFLVAEIQGWDKIADDPQYGTDVVIEQFGKKLGLKADDQLAAAKAQAPLIKPSGDTRVLSMSPEAIKATIATLVKQDIAASESLFDSSLIDEAYRKLEDK